LALKKQENEFLKEAQQAYRLFKANRMNVGLDFTSVRTQQLELLRLTKKQLDLARSKILQDVGLLIPSS